MLTDTRLATYIGKKRLVDISVDFWVNLKLSLNTRNRRMRTIIMLMSQDRICECVH